MLLHCQCEAAVGRVAVDRDVGLRGCGWAWGPLGGRGLKKSPDAAGEVAFEAAQRFAAALAVGLLASEIVGGGGVQAAFADGEAVQRAVERADRRQADR